MSDRIEFTVTGQRLRTDTMNVHTFAEGTMESVVLQFHLSDSWDGYTVFAHFRQDDRFFDEVLHTIDEVGDCCYLPIGAKNGDCSLSLYGRNEDGHVLTTNCLMLHIKQNGVVSENYEMPQSMAEHIISMFIKNSDSGNVVITRDTTGWNTDKIYVYTGNDPEYSVGSWYYYNGSEWVQGGAYVAGTDLQFITQDMHHNLLHETSFGEDTDDYQSDVRVTGTILSKTGIASDGYVVGDEIDGNTFYSTGDFYAHRSLDNFEGDKLATEDYVNEKAAEFDKDVMHILTGSDLLSLSASYNDVDDDDPTGNGVNYTWSDGVCHIDGDQIPNTVSYNLMWNYDDGFPWWMVPGKEYHIRVTKTNTDEGAERVNLVFNYYDQGTTPQSLVFGGDGILTVPEGKTGVSILIRIDRTTSGGHVACDFSAGIYQVTKFSGDVYANTDKKLATEEKAEQIVAGTVTPIENWIDAGFGNRLLQFKDGYYYPTYTPGSGQTVDINAPDKNAAWMCAWAEVTPGEVVTLKVEGQTGTHGGYAFLNPDMVCIQVAGQALAATERTVTVPAGAKYIVVNNRITNQVYYAVIGDSAKYKIAGIKQMEKYNAVEQMRFVRGYHYLYAPGYESIQPIDPETPTASNNHVCAYAACVEGDTFEISVRGGTGVACAYGFLDSGKECILRGGEAALIENAKITAPAGAAWFCVNNLATVYDGYYAAKINGDVFERKTEVNNTVRNAITEAVINPSSQEITVSALEGDRFIRYESGAVGTAAISGVHSVSDYVNIKGYSQLKLKLPCSNLNSPSSGYAFYDAGKTFVKGVQTIGRCDEVGYTERPVTLDIPEDARYIRLTMLSETFTMEAVSQQDAAIDRVGRPFRKTINTAGLTWENGFYNDSGDYYNSTSAAAVKRTITSNMIDVPVGTKIKFAGAEEKDGTPYVAWLIEFNGDGTFVRRRYFFSVTYGHTPVVTTAPKIKFSYSHPNSTDELIDPSEGVLFAIEEETPAELSLDNKSGDYSATSSLISEPLPSAGVQNAVLNARQFTDIRWTPLKDTPGLKKNNVTGEYDYVPFKAGVRQRGIPYSRQDSNSRQVSMNIGFSAFATACLFPNSKIYTKNEYNETIKRATYYGVVCSKMVQAAWGLPEVYNSEEIGNLPDLELVASAGTWTENDIRVGDGVIDPTVHCTICTDILRDTQGVVRAIEISEAVTPSARRLRWSVKDFFEHFATYSLYRYSKIDDVKYNKNPYIDLEDGFTGQTDFPIKIREGCFVNVAKNTVLEADVDSQTWTTLHIIRNGSEIGTGTNIATDEITLPTDVVGHYDVYPTDSQGNAGNKSSYYVYAASESYSISGSELTVATTSASTPRYIVFLMSNSDHVIADYGNNSTTTVNIPTDSASFRVLYETEYGIWRGSTHTVS